MDLRIFIRALVLFGAFGAGCTQSVAMISPLARLAQAHNTRQESQRLGRVVEGSLAEGSTQIVQLTLGARCTTIGAFGSDTVREMVLSVRDAQGTLMAGASARDQEPSVRFCPPQAGVYAVSLTVARGNGSFAVGTWAEELAQATVQRARPSDGTCQAPYELELGTTIRGSTTDGRSMHSSSCAAEEYGTGTNELIYHLRVLRRSALTVVLETDWKSALSVRDQCGDVESERGCSAPGADQEMALGIRSYSPTVVTRPSTTPTTSEERSPRLSIIVEPGNYFVVVDGQGESGEFTHSTRVDPVPTENERCQSAPLLASGVAVDGSTVGEFDFFHSVCASHARGPDRSYRLELAQRSRVQIELGGTQFPAVIHVHNRCSRSDDEVACESQQYVNFGTGELRVNTLLEPGTHYVVVDGVASSNAGTFNLQADVLPANGGTLVGDRCSDAIPLVIGGSVDGNTFAAHDDVTLPCGAPENGLDQVFRLELTERSVVRIQAYGDLGSNASVQLTRSCDGPQDRAMCRSHMSEQENALTRVLPAGTHYVVVESSRAGEFGKFSLSTIVTPAAGVENACNSARQLTADHPVDGVNRGRGIFDGSCAGADDSPESVFRLVIERSSDVELTVHRIGQRASGDTAAYAPAIYVRRDCVDTISEMQCAEAGDDSDTATLTFHAERGTYYVFVDGSARGPARWRLNAEVQPL